MTACTEGLLDLQGCQTMVAHTAVVAWVTILLMSPPRAKKEGAKFEKNEKERAEEKRTQKIAIEKRGHVHFK